MGNIDNMESAMLNSLVLFSQAVDAKPNLNIVCAIETDGSGSNECDKVVIENSNIPKNIEGHQVTADVPEIFAKVRDEGTAKHFVKVINGECKSISLEGVTRIVGYYSRVNNWNKSKIGELRDRNQKHYALGNASPEHDKDRHTTINNM